VGGRKLNRRVEMIVSGDVIGDVMTPQTGANNSSPALTPANQTPSVPQR